MFADMKQLTLTLTLFTLEVIVLKNSLLLKPAVVLQDQTIRMVRSERYITGKAVWVEHWKPLSQAPVQCFMLMIVIYTASICPNILCSQCS